MQKILLVEDDVSLSEMYKQLLEAEGYEVLVARDKITAFNTVLKEEIGFVLLDFMLAEDTNGMDLLEDIQSSKKANLVPIVLLTNNVNEEEKQKAMALGAKGYLAKAKQKPEDIVNLVKTHLTS